MFLYNPPVPSHPFDRYASFTDVPALKAASDCPLRKSVRVNTLKCSVEEFRSWAKERGWTLAPVPWWPEGFFVEREDLSMALGRDIRHLLGHFYMQEAASMLPVALLDPQPGEAVLDLCAAPGSKTTQIAARTEGKGVCVANDMQEKRLRILNDAVQRTGAASVVVTRKVGQWFARHCTERFDRVVCDAPCTAQGTARKDPTALQYSSQEAVDKATRLQYQLLEAAVHATKTGGRIVYSTCTLTPEENEQVVRDILNKFSDQLEVMHPKEALPSGLNWDMHAAISDSQTVQKSLSPSSFSLRPSPFSLRPLPFLRLWPQTYDTEGFFCAVLRKTKPTRAVERVEMIARSADPLGRRKTETVTQLFQEQFGADFLLPGERVIEKGNFLLLMSEEAYAFPLPMMEYACGIPYAKVLPDGRFRITNEAASLRGRMATKNVLELTDDMLRQLLDGRDISCASSLKGDVILRYRSIELGLGLAKEGILLNRLPRWVVKLGST